jgi:hypothetical protein
MSAAAYDMHAGAERSVIAMMGCAMRATSTADHAENFLRHARTFVLAEGAALTGVLKTHHPSTRTSRPAGCENCGTAEACHTLRQINASFAAYLTDPPPGIDRAEAWRRADAWFNADRPQRTPLVLEESADTYLAWAAPRTPGPDGCGLLIVDKRTGRLITSPGDIR